MEAKTDDPRYRWNLFVSAVLHVALIGAVMMWAAFAPKQADQPVWLELGMGGEAGGGSGSEGGGNQDPSLPSTTPAEEPPPAPPGQPAVVEEAPKPPPKPAPKFDTVKPAPTPKEETHQPVIHTEPPKKSEKPKPQAKAQVKPPPPPKAEDTNKVKISTKLMQRQKAGAPDSKALNSKGTGPADSKGKNLKAGRSFNADSFRKGMFNKLGYGSSGGTGPGTGIGKQSGPGRGRGPGQYAGAGTGPGNRPGTGGGLGTGPGTGGGLPSEFGWYYRMIKDAMDRAWTQPSQLQGHLTCVVFIRIQRDGTLSGVWFDQRSGNPVMDESVLSAVNSVRRIQPLPPGLGNAYVDIPVAFELKPKGPG
ncbi:MAG: energy transducer TonB [Verrucomicrobia bacterium]|nr:energy transducer TonB [Verrucomicrobiota bacterium]